jgi:hypothetical protein
LKTLHGSMQAMNNGTAYLARAVSYTGWSFVKLIPGDNVIKLFTAISYEFL